MTLAANQGASRTGAVSPQHAKNALHLLEERALLRVVPIEGKGRGVVAALPFARGELLERAHVIVIPEGHAPLLDVTVLEHYVYDWPEGRVAVALGHGSLFNHSYRPNARYRRDLEAQQLVFEALTDIAPGEEITINYNGDPADRTPLWFAVVDS
ncbi:MAG: SET domain-containing protein-lysine N-methyltransferase [Deltaproteobacteria bacterium]|nr:SET domain-containing protein-lysine N-methyltransferase [Deltaproteobacteria bacterium]